MNCLFLELSIYFQTESMESKTTYKEGTALKSFLTLSEPVFSGPLVNW